jgi:hypothetical protein
MKSKKKVKAAKKAKPAAKKSKGRPVMGAKGRSAG